MQAVLIVVHLMVVLALVVVVLLQRSEGGGLGIGGGSGGFMTGRGQANLLTRTTAILAAAFFLTSIVLSILAGYRGPTRSILDQVVPAGQPAGQAAPVSPTTPGSILDQLKGAAQPQQGGTAAPGAASTPAQPSSPQVPQSR